MKKTFGFLGICGILIIFFFLSSKTSFTLTESEIRITGTSTLHDWEITSNAATGEAEIDEGKSHIQEIKALKVTIPSESLKSGTKSMDKNTYAALKTETHKNIVFVLRKVDNLNTSNGETVVSARGDLTIAGVTRAIQVKARGYVKNQKIQFEGSYPLKMTDYNIDPPTAVMGTIKTGNDITVHYKVSFNTKKQFL